MDKATLAKAILCAMITNFPNESKVNGHFISDPDFDSLCDQAIQMAEKMEQKLNKNEEPIQE